MIFGRTGADALAFFLKHICRTLLRYEVKLLAAIDALESASDLTAEQAAVAKAFISTVGAACTVFQIIAGKSGF